MGIKIGNLDVSYFKVGRTDCSIYLGDTKLYPEDVPPTPHSFDGKYKFTLTDDSVVSGECDASSSELTKSEVSAYTTTLKEAVVGDCVTSIGGGAFGSCSSLTSIDIPDSVTSINNAAFSGCTSLTSIDIPSGVTSINANAFRSCSALASVVIPSGVTSINVYAFGYCSSLTSIVIPSGVTSIGRGAFQNCSGLTSITVNAITPPTLASINAFNSTNNCPIYVPDASVSAYKSATNWKTFASRIQAIPT